MPAGVVTAIGPVVAPTGTATVSWVPAAFTAKPGAAVPFRVTAVVPVKLVPTTTMLVPATPLAGVKLATVGVVVAPQPAFRGVSRAVRTTAVPAPPAGFTVLAPLGQRPVGLTAQLATAPDNTLRSSTRRMPVGRVLGTTVV